MDPSLSYINDKYQTAILNTQKSNIITLLNEVQTYAILPLIFQKHNVYKYLSPETHCLQVFISEGGLKKGSMYTVLPLFLKNENASEGFESMI